MSGTSERNPFVGPRPIQQGEPLYGRTAEVRELFNRLQARRIVVLHSPSGAGKSSLVQAGLIPALKANHFDVWKPIRINLDPSGLSGIPAGTNRYLLSAMVSLEEELPAAHRRTPAQLATLDFLTYLEGRPRRKGSVERAVVLLFDQFEEVLTVAPRGVEEKKAFFAAVGRALDTGKFWALFIVREDYLAALAPYRERIPTQLSNTFRLDLLAPAGAREAAEQLARDGGRTFPAVDQLIHDLSTVQVQQADGSFVMEPGLYVEPVYLQVVCRRLWEAMPKDDLTIDPEDMARYAGVSKSLGAYYAEAVTKIAGGDLAVERAIREWAGTSLVVDGIRSQVRQEKDQSGGLPNPLIEALLDSYLVRTEQRAGANWFELSHDRLVEPIQKDNLAWEEAHLHPLQVQAKLWERSRRSQALLLGARALAEAVTWARDHDRLVTAGEKEFLALSQKLRAEEARHQWRQGLYMVVLAAVALVALGLGGWAVKKQRQAIAAARKAQENETAAHASEERALAAQAVAAVAHAAQEQAANKEKEALTIKLEAIQRLEATQRAAAEQARTVAIIASARDLLSAREGGLAAVVLDSVKEPETAGWKSLANETLAQQIPQTTVRHSAGVHHAAWSPDGQRLVTAADDGTVRIWRADGRGDALVFKGHTERVNCAAWSPNGKQLVTASSDSTARIWNADGSGVSQILKGHTDAVNSAVWSPDGRYIVTAAWDDTARVWKVGESGGGVVLSGHKGVVYSAAWSHDGKRIVTASWDTTARVWTAPDAAIVLKGHQFAVNSAAWSPDDQRIVTASDDNTARVWNADGKGEPLVLAGHTSGVNFAAWSHDGKRLVTTSSDWTARVWTIDGKNVPTIIQGHKGEVLTAGWSANDQRLVTASEDGMAIVSEPDGLRDPIYLPGHLRAILAAAWSPDSKRIVTASADQSARVWDIPAAKDDSVGILLKGDAKPELTIPELKKRLHHATTDCLVPAQRLKLYTESWSEATTRYTECAHEHARTRADRDGDGILDVDDRCPDAPAGRHPDPSRPGCSEDSDGDGVLDSVDRCPLEPAGEHPHPKRPGCPDVDIDGDGIYDSVDACPLVTAGLHRDPKRPGCPAKDTDGDGVYDANDLCPKEPAGSHPDLQRSGCPDKDTDSDGVYDSVDLCPNLPAGPRPDAKRPGCPELDTDGDGVNDSSDRCPNVPAGPQPDPKRSGCPDLDRDGDGVGNRRDSCPDEPGSAENSGCPLDTDKDGILDQDDQCPYEPGPVQTNGCPPPRKYVTVTAERIEFTGKIEFADDKEVILPLSFSELAAAAAAMKSRPTMVIAIEGHTADTGDLAHDMWLSERRARSVLRYFVAQGVTADRLTARGYGPKRPLASNRTLAGRAKNSRVEFVVMHQ